MLSIAKINSSKNQAKRGGGGYLHYLGGPTSSTKPRGDFDEYARGDSKQSGALPFWARNGAALLGLEGAAHPERS